MRMLLVEGAKTFRVGIPSDAKITFGPWSPPKKRRDGQVNIYSEGHHPEGTLRIYQADGKSVIACFANVTGFRDLSLVDYAELIAKEEGAAIWKSDQNGYERHDNVTRTREWVDPEKQIEGKKKGKK